MKTFLLSLIVPALLVACNKEPEPVADKPAPQGREETRGIRSTEALGYSGNAIANKVDTVIETNEHRTEQLDKEIEAQQ